VARAASASSWSALWAGGFDLGGSRPLIRKWKRCESRQSPLLRGQRRRHRRRLRLEERRELAVVFVDVRCGHVGVAVDWHEEPVRIELEQRREAERDLEAHLERRLGVLRDDGNRARVLEGELTRRTTTPTRSTRAATIATLGATDVACTRPERARPLSGATGSSSLPRIVGDPQGRSTTREA